jgi:hypothetical protein
VNPERSPTPSASLLTDEALDALGAGVFRIPALLPHVGVYFLQPDGTKVVATLKT